ncbi:hypothetical protein GCM10008995_08680 [Halobellus salinus]|uniref:VanZ family protein n=1 Tax=Halobellus salinus TaxID=931585 RepID=A0A830EFV9_9EURY|nr:VanZ family protein [Halobellus salinus]GGJ01070.1 hypothetical protein GCM10008995_08680 [Halobellus salinus]SMP00741.1 hypothetical protein SAMN06265347_10134 [Halobellus salinus]
MTGDSDTRASVGTTTGHTGRRARRAAVAWTLVIVAASLVDPAAILKPLGASRTAGAGGTGGAAAFATAHLVAYGVLAWLLGDGLDPNTDGFRAVVTAIAVATAVGVGVELLQAPVAARTAGAPDALVNAVGATVGAGLHAALDGRRRR